MPASLFPKTEHHKPFEKTNALMIQMTLPFFLALGISFASALPFGPVNLSVMDASLQHNTRVGLRMAFAAAFMEMCQAIIALSCSRWLSQWFTHSPWAKILAMVVFAVLGLFFLFKNHFRNEKPASVTKRRQFLAGAAVNLANPQIIPFWIVVIAWLGSSGIVKLDTHSSWYLLFFFALGILLGKGSALSMYSLFSGIIKKKAHRLSTHMNRVIGVILLSIGLYHGFTAMLS